MKRSQAAGFLFFGIGASGFSALGGYIGPNKAMGLFGAACAGLMMAGAFMVILFGEP